MICKLRCTLNAPEKCEQCLYGKKSVPPKQDAGFMKVGPLSGRRHCFHINRF